VRPLVSPEVIKLSFEKAEQFGGSIPVVSPAESLRQIKDQISKPVNRIEYRLVQTPQTFRSELIKKAYDKPYEERFTDDASVFEADGNTISLIQGNRENIKITWPSDVVFAEALMSSPDYQDDI
jgi:2-C-methyl-D-erythritol 4-phosphate cytidylyltransferase